MGRKMIDMIPGVLTGLISGAIIGWVIGHHWASQGTSDSDESSSETTLLEDHGDEHMRIENVTRRIRSLTLSVAADVSAHQSKVADITTDLEVSAAQSQTETIIATVAELVAANRSMQEKLAESQQQIREQSKQLQTTQQLAFTDALTGLANRRYFDSEMDKVKDTIGPERGSLALIDIDHFKSVNDIYGHPTGDQVLGRVAELLDANLGDIAICSRFGGEEFAIFYPSPDWEVLAKSLDQIRLQLANLRLIPDDPVRQITFSCGVAPHVADEQNDAWLARVDASLYAAKNDDRNNVHIDCGSGPGPQRYSESVKQIEPLIAVSTESQAGTTSRQNQECSTGVSRAPSENRACLISQLRTMANNIDLKHVSVAAVAIRLPDLQYTHAHREELMHEMRGLLRAVDRIGFDDNRTLLVLMVTSNMSKTEERANQLVDHINAALRKLGGNAAAIDLAMFGISALEDNLAAEDVISLAVERAVEEVSASV